MSELHKFSANLLFQYRVMVDGDPGKRRSCEKRIIHFKSTDPEEAYKHAMQHGKKSQHKYKNSDKNWVYFDFVGIIDLMHCGVECEEEEVWYQTLELLEPKERKSKHLLPKKEMHAFRTL